MYTEQLLYLIDIAKTGSISATAKRLFTSQSSVSEAIKKLEQEFNCTILNRSKTGVTLTEEGVFILAHINAIMDHYDTIMKKFCEKTVLRGHISLGVAVTITNTILETLIFNMYTQYPEVSLSARELLFEDILDGLIHNEIDYGIAGPYDKSIIEYYSEQLTFLPLYSDPIVCVVHKNNPLVMRNEIYGKELSSIPHTTYGYTSSDYFPHATRVHMSSNASIHKRFMQQHGTALIVPKHAADILFSSKEHIRIPFLDVEPITFYLIYRNEKNMSELHHAFIQTLAEITSN